MSCEAAGAASLLLLDGSYPEEVPSAAYILKSELLHMKGIDRDIMTLPCDYAFDWGEFPPPQNLPGSYLNASETSPPPI